ncbi:hypothetical protein K491DRAFT_283439 [Lophiostoma macrostomum CBS 122681]|uniref:Uncharacterized protein n=1 Tax=Lophiostoma macrostomum CBS 122681 TaxID=1314788 RepID=A0A6A6TQW8_9PLEO|nr:hypothetical protein K491DRAFT_283439 [Lophiostoma macrostomum CBS 122681]
MCCCTSSAVRDSIDNCSYLVILRLQETCEPLTLLCILAADSRVGSKPREQQPRSVLPSLAGRRNSTASAQSLGIVPFRPPEGKSCVGTQQRYGGETMSKRAPSARLSNVSVQQCWGTRCVDVRLPRSSRTDFPAESIVVVSACRLTQHYVRRKPGTVAGVAQGGDVQTVQKAPNGPRARVLVMVCCCAAILAALPWMPYQNNIRSPRMGSAALEHCERLLAYCALGVQWDRLNPASVILNARDQT